MLIDEGWKHSIMVPGMTRVGFASSGRRRLLQALSAIAVGITAVSYASDALARRESAVQPYQTSQSVVPLSSLPVQAQDVHRRILNGGPFSYDKDGIVFGNRERSLPHRARGFYREYTVRTPGASGRGPRRIVCGGKEVQRPETCFYTEDHYNSFYRIDPQQ